MTRRRILIFGGAAIALLLIAALAAWWFLLRSTAPDAVSLEEAVAAVTSDASSSTVGTTATTASTASESSSLEGEWNAAPGSGSFAGYRVREELAQVGFATAAGRTEDLSATLTIEGSMVTMVEVTVDMTTLRSDDNRRDRSIQTQALETSVFTTATFTLVDPIELPQDAGDGIAFATTAVGDLTLHGVTRTVTLDIEAQLIDDVIAAIGSTGIVFSDYDIAPPQAPILLGVEDNGEMEFQLLFSRS